MFENHASPTPHVCMPTAQQPRVEMDEASHGHVEVSVLASYECLSRTFRAVGERLGGGEQACPCLVARDDVISCSHTGHTLAYTLHNTRSLMAKHAGEQACSKHISASGLGTQTTHPGTLPCDQCLARWCTDTWQRWSCGKYVDSHDWLSVA